MRKRSNNKIAHVLCAHVENFIRIVLIFLKRTAYSNNLILKYMRLIIKLQQLPNGRDLVIFLNILFLFSHKIFLHFFIIAVHNFTQTIFQPQFSQTILTELFCLNYPYKTILFSLNQLLIKIRCLYKLVAILSTIIVFEISKIVY